MLKIEVSLSCIEAAEPEVQAVYRSRDALPLLLDGAPSLPLQAFVCVVGKEDALRIFAALHVKNIKRNLVFSIADVLEGRDGCDAASKGALAVFAAIGFEMESVNLKFSRAMREVMIRDIPVLLSPAAARKAVAQKAEELAELERLAMYQEESDSSEQTAALSPARRAARERAHQERQAAAKAAARRLAAEKDAEEKMAHVRLGVGKLLVSQFAAVPLSGGKELASKEVAPEAHDSAEGPGPATFSLVEKVGEPGEWEQMVIERERLMAEKEAAERWAAELAETARLATQRADAERAERERLTAEMEAAERRAIELAETARQAVERAESERAERERLVSEMAAAERRAAELSEAVRQAESMALATRAEREREASELAKTQRVEREQLIAEKAEAERRAADLAEAAQQAAQRIEGERAEREQLVAEKAAAERRAAEVAERERAERRAAELAEAAREAAKRAEAERAERERLAAEKSAAERRSAELAEAVRRAAEQVEAQRAERERLIAQKAAQRTAELAQEARRAAPRTETARQADRIEALRDAGGRLGDKKVQAAHATPAVEERHESGTSLPSSHIKMLPSLGGLFDSGRRSPDLQATAPKRTRPSVPGAFFQVDWDLAGIACDSLEDVLEVRQSINMTQLSLEGYPNQYCSAGIVALKKGEGREVFVVFRLTASNRILVYVPRKHPGNQDAYAQTMKEACKFLRVSGIETERLLLGKSSQSRAKALGKVSILCASPRSVENF